MTTSLIQSYLVSIPEKEQALNGTSIPMRSAGYIGQARLINACSPEDQLEEDAQDKVKNRAMEWKQFRPSLIYSLWNSLYFGFLISVLAAALIGTLSIIVYYVAYQVTLVCLGRSKDSVPWKIQWSKTISECMEIIFFIFVFFLLILCFTLNRIKSWEWKENFSWYLSFSMF